jgi:Na+-translocating ferredoxin:NAD+ oxidoreductase RnfC subunit
MKPDDIIQRVREAGVVGAGGGGFPTHVKLASPVETVVANGAECEPLLHKDKEILRIAPQEIAEGLLLAGQATGARRNVVALKEKYEELAGPFRALSPGTRPDIHLVGDYYPAGDEFDLVESVAKRLVPAGRFPPHVGVLVQNVETLWNVARALKGLPVIEKFITVAGAVREPGTFRVPLGVSIQQVIDLAGGPTAPAWVCIAGGPMMGPVPERTDAPVTKTMAGLVVLPSIHPLVARKTLSLEWILRRAQSACTQCCLCTDACPRYLLGHSLEPHRVMRRASHAGVDDLEGLEEVLLCSECSCCELFACPMHLSPREVCSRLKARLLARGARWSGNGSRPTPHPMRSSRRIPARRLVSRLSLGPYDQSAPLREVSLEPGRVVLPLSQHAGEPAQPVAHAGDFVRRGQVLAELPSGRLGARLHASISGRVVSTEKSVIIEA